LIRQRSKTLSITNDNENAAEAHESGSVDFVVNARELYRIFLHTGIDLKKRRPTALDSFGEAEPDRTGLLAPNTWSICAEPRSFDLTVNGDNIQTVDAPTLGKTRLLLDEVRSGASSYRLFRFNA